MSSDFVTPVRRTTLTADVCRKLVGHLIRGDWAAGEQLPPERLLCQQLGIGRASLREALKALEIMGMIETRLGEGTFVCRRSEFFSRPLLWAITGADVSETQELVEARTLIEVELAGLAAERSTEGDREAIADALDHMEAALRNPKRFLDADIEFHLAVAEAGHNRLLLNSILLIRNLMREWVSHALLSDGVALEALEQHRRVFAAITAGHREPARQAMQEHLASMARHLAVAEDRSSEIRPARLAAGEGA